ncbi:ferritin-like domain-containing protein [Ekhidna sp. To15]|uniref:ferritin-like domain-containing protein n=1 Tax=Ekhidna sp. To15 TaxID=3395267 RepID=UPI003F5289D2
MIHTSLFWKNHFEHNLNIQRVDWSIQPNINNAEKQEILYSLRAWQLGETSDGSHLLSAAMKYAKRIEEPTYPNAVKLFIKEEQKHGSNLGRYIDLIGEERMEKDWGDSIFRKIRYFNTSMELWTITVIIVEYAAQIFYKALSNATNCQLLKSICKDILIDEAHHIKFQNERLYQIFRKKSFYSKAFSIGWYGILFFGTVHAVWTGHSKAFKAGGVDKKEFMQRMYYKFFTSMKFCHSYFQEVDAKCLMHV